MWHNCIQNQCKYARVWLRLTYIHLSQFKTICIVLTASVLLVIPKYIQSDIPIPLSGCVRRELAKNDPPATLQGHHHSDVSSTQNTIHNTELISILYYISLFQLNLAY